MLQDLFGYLQRADRTRVFGLVIVAGLSAALGWPGSAAAWQNALRDPGFERYQFDAQLGYYVPTAEAAWREFGPGQSSVRFDASSWSAPTEMSAERPLGFSPGTTGYEGPGHTQNSGMIVVEQDVLNSLLLHSGERYEAWIWLGGAGKDNETGVDRKDEAGGWDIYFYADLNTANWREDNALEHHHASMDYSGLPNGFVRVSGAGRLPAAAAGFRFRAWATAWATSSTPAAYDTQVAIDNAHFAIISGQNMLRNGDFEQDVNTGDFKFWLRPSIYPFGANGLIPLDVDNAFGDNYDHGTFRPYYGGTRAYGYYTYLSGWLMDGFTFSQTTNYTVAPGTPVILTFYWAQDARVPGGRWLLRDRAGSVQLYIEYLGNGHLEGAESLYVNWPVVAHPDNLCPYDQNGGIAFNPRFRLVPPAATTQIRVNVSHFMDLPYNPDWEFVISSVDDFDLRPIDQPASIFNARSDQIAYRSARVRWLTDVFIGTIVDYGTTPAYGQTASEPTPVQSHAITLTGLKPGRRYHYRVKSGLATYPPAASADDVFFTLPAIGDLDADGDVDMEDFGRFQVCLSGEDVPQTATACAASRFDADTDVDAADAEILLGCMSGPTIPLDPDCAD